MRVRPVATLLILVALLWVAWQISSGPEEIRVPQAPTPTPSPELSGEPSVPHAVSPESIGEAGSEPPAEVSRETAEAKKLSIQGTVFTQGGLKPAARARVICAGPTGSGREALTAADGTFKFDSLRPGAVTLVAEPREAVDGQVAMIQAEAGDTAVRIVLGPRGIVRLEILDASTRRPVVTALKVIDVTVTWERTLRTSDGGLMPPDDRIELSPSRDLRIRVKAEGYESSPTIHLEFDPVNLTRVRRVMLTPDGIPKATLVLWPRYPSGLAPKHIQVRRVGVEGGGDKTRRVLRDRVEITLPAGDNELLISPGDFWSPRWVAFHLRIRLEPGESAKREVTFVRGGTIVVRGPDPKARAEIEIVRDGPEYRGGRITETYGGVTWVRIGPLTPGKWTLRAPDCQEVVVDLAAKDTKRLTLQPR